MNRETLMTAGGKAATVRRVTRERDQAMLAAWRDGWSVSEIGRVTGFDRRRVAEIIEREQASG